MLKQAANTTAQQPLSPENPHMKKALKWEQEKQLRDARNRPQQPGAAPAPAGTQPIGKPAQPTAQPAAPQGAAAKKPAGLRRFVKPKSAPTVKSPPPRPAVG